MRNIIEVLLFVLGPLIALTFLVRVSMAVFSVWSLNRMRRHPVVHTLWGMLALVAVLFIFWSFHPRMWPSDLIRRHFQRKEVFARVTDAGGWDAVRLACEQLVSNNPDGLVLAYQSPDFFFPTAIAALHPQTVSVRTPEMAQASENRPTNLTKVSIGLYGQKRTGPPVAPYYGLAVYCGPGAGGYDPRTNSSEHRLTYRKLADRVYEVHD